MTAEWLTAWAGVATALVTGAAVAVAWFQLRGIRVSLGLASLMAVLEIETQMNERKVQLDRSSADVRQAALDKLAPEAMAIRQALFASAKENYFNALDRLCFCMLKDYLKDKDWKTEYRNVIHGTIAQFPNDFNAASEFRNIKAIDAKWQAT